MAASLVHGQRSCCRPAKRCTEGLWQAMKAAKGHRNPRAAATRHRKRLPSVTPMASRCVDTSRRGEGLCLRHEKRCTPRLLHFVGKPTQQARLAATRATRGMMGVASAGGQPAPSAAHVSRERRQASHAEISKPRMLSELHPAAQGQQTLHPEGVPQEGTLAEADVPLRGMAEPP
eukprot:TRINITY_DN33936_c0_g1_i1.p2 TRINITY_DN33936_c0_g1~~TRINITY_DN33936_c0_g1_i1.p2  ORF type:complete len:175 (-),score=6.76 TRINITY_DN33936_c0_g1_i1:4-528(-)